MADDIRLVLSVDDRDLIRARKEQEKYQYRLAQIEKEYRKGNITAARYNAELAKQAKELAKLGGSYNKANSEVRKYAYSLRKATDDQLNLAQALTKSGKGMRRMELAAQQAGYQIGDFAVQVQSGTNVAVAFGQQMSQMLGFFGPTGAIAGAGIAIATGLVAPLLQAKKAAAELGKEIKELLDEAEERLKALQLGASAEELKFVDKIALAQLQLDKARKALQQRKERLTGAMGGGSDIQWKAEADAVAAAQEALSEANAEYQRFLEIKAKIAAADPLDPFGGAGRDVESSEQREERLNSERDLLQQIQTDAMAMEAEIAQEKLDNIKRNYQFAGKLMREGAEEQAEIDAARAEAFYGTLQEQQQRANEFYDAAVTGQNELNDAAEVLGERLGIAFGTAIELIKQAKAEATIGLDAFGGAGDFKYSYKSTFDPSKGKGGGGGKKETASEYLKSLMDEAKYKRSLIGLSEQEQRVQEILHEAKKKELVLTKEQAQAVAKIEEETRRLQQTQELYDTIQGHIENGFMSLIDGSKSVADAFKDMLRNILIEIYRQKVAEAMAKNIMSLFSANGNVFNAGGGLTAFANGGVVNSPTLFGYSGGTGLMGEAGPEAIMPLKRGADGKLGVAGGGGVVVHQTFNFAANGDDSVKKIIAQAAPQIAEMTKRSVIADRRRGGQMKAAFN